VPGESIPLTKTKALSLPLEILLWSTALLIPLLLPGPQLLIGTLVNVILFLASTRLSQKKLVVLAVLPSLAALAHGLLFGSYTIYTVYFLPFIWLGNFVLMYINKKTQSFIYAGFTKAFLLTCVALILVNFKIVPQLFLTAMSAVQLLTALSAGLIYYLYERYR
jgi:hypothetical protein